MTTSTKHTDKSEGLLLISDSIPTESLVRIEIAKVINEIIDDPDYFFKEWVTKPPDSIVEYLKKTGCPYPENGVSQSDIAKLAIRYWATREALSCIKWLYDSECNK